jgi:hypothetical protein
VTWLLQSPSTRTLRNLSIRLNARHVNFTLQFSCCIARIFCGDKTIVNADYLIDDQTRHLRSFHGAGILFSAPHNWKETGCCRVESWEEIRQLLLEGHGTAKRDGSREAGAAVPPAPPGSIAHTSAQPRVANACHSIDPLILFVVLLADRLFSCRHGLHDGLSDLFVV